MMSSQLPYRCRRCDFELWIPVASLAVSEVGFYNDRRFPGRCLVVVRDHYEHLARMPESTYLSFTRDMRQVGGSLHEAVGANRVNYAVLGNTEPHVHAHVIPRGAPGDEKLHRTPWEHPAPKAQMPRDQVEAIVGRLRESIDSSTPA